MSVNVALIQTAPKRGNLNYNRSRVSELIHKAMKNEKRPDLILLPETWTSAYGPGDPVEQAKTNAEAVSGESISMLRELAKEYNVWIAAGSITLKTEELQDKYYNTMFLINRQGEIVTDYSKIHLCAWVDEDAVFEYGKDPVTVSTEIGVLGLVICYDIRFPELVRINALSGAEILLVPACFSTNVQHWRNMLLARAIENQMFVLGCDCCGGDDIKYLGHSMIVDPSGNILAEAGDDEEIIFASLDLTQVEKVRKTVKYLDDRQPEVYFGQES